MAQEQELVVRRAKSGDAGEIAAFVNRVRRGLEIDRVAVIMRMGSVGFLIAERAGDLIGVLGWQAENLVVRITDLLIQPAHERDAISHALLSEMEQAAKELQCEAALLLLPRPILPEWINFCKAFGYEAQAISSLPNAWQEAAHEARLEDGRTVMVKELSSRRATLPL
jgi:N-acetylglutamate synthase-like GNAT family acetyltransferase